MNGTAELNVALTVPFSPASMNISVGTSYVNPIPSSAWELRYDNVLFTAN